MRCVTMAVESVMRLSRLEVGSIRRERGFTLPELLAAIAILGILGLSALLLLLALIERWRVEAAADQLAADLRFAHTSATNQLADWRVVLLPQTPNESSREIDGPDYYMVRLNGVHRPGGAEPAVRDAVGRALPANVRVMDHNPELNDAESDRGRFRPTDPLPLRTRTLEFNSDGTMAFRSGPAGSVCVTVDGSPKLVVTVLSATSRVKVGDRKCPPAGGH